MNSNIYYLATLPSSMPTATQTPALTTCQETALHKLEREGNIFLTGAAGTGKSYLLAHYLHNKSPLAFPIVASTGAAAVLVGGRTFHSFFGLGILEGGAEATIAKALKNGKLRNRLNLASCVIIDEVSMLSGVHISVAERIARKLRGNEAPWGGLRIIAVGDFAQLPPITHTGASRDWAFLHEAWEQSEFQPALLNTVMRTQDTHFLKILNYVRAGIVNDEVEDFLNSRMPAEGEAGEGTRLYAHRAKAEAYNLQKLTSLHTREHVFTTQYAGNERYMDTGKKAMPIPEALHLKTGALVMMRKNDPSPEHLYVNGSLGIVKHIDEETIAVELFTGETLPIEKAAFTYLDGDGNELLVAWNFPVTLAWATTIHKAQGCSLDCMTVDLSALWEPGQAYVALSRVRSGQGLTVERWSPGGIRAEPIVTDLYQSLTEQSDSYVEKPLFTVKALTPVKKIKKTETEGVRQQRAELIRTLLEEKVPFSDIVQSAGVKPDRVLLYIEQFIESGTPLSIGYLLEEIKNASYIREQFEDMGTERLKPVFEALEETVSFTDLRLVRCVMASEANE